MNFERFKEQLAQADNDSLVVSLIEHAKKMDEDLNYYEAVKLIKKELLERLDGEPVAEKDWREELTAEEVQVVLQQYEQGADISIIQKGLSDNVSQKAIRAAVAKVYGVQEECERCGTTIHIAHAIGQQVYCVQCGIIKK